MSRPFHFKQFSIYQDKAAMKVGTDGVLLGAWADVEGAEYILDIGAGTGLLALMAAQRNPSALIDAIEMDEQAYFQAKENIERSPWENRINVFHTTIQAFVREEKRYDAIICNPPYFQNSLKAPDASRTTARHNDQLTLDELFNSISNLLNINGKACLIFPAETEASVIKLSEKYMFYPSKIVAVHPTPNKPSKRILIELKKHKINCERSKLIIEEEVRHQYSEAFKELTKEFYLNHK